MSSLSPMLMASVIGDHPSRFLLGEGRVICEVEGNVGDILESTVRIPDLEEHPEAVLPVQHETQVDWGVASVVKFINSSRIRAPDVPEKRKENPTDEVLELSS